MWSDFLQDIRYGFRRLRSNPGFTLVVVAVLALGIGANTAIFSLVNGVLLQPLPYEGGDRLVVLRQGAPRAGIENVPFSVHEIEDYRRDSKSFEAVVEYHNMQFNLIGRGDPQRAETGVVSWQFFDVFGIRPIAGRAFRAEDEAHGAPPVVLLSYEYWRRSFGGDKSIVGQTFEMNGKVHSVIGVLPPIPQYPNENDVYMPTSACPFRSADAFMANRNARMMQVFAKLKPGVSIEQARANIAAIGGNFELQYPQAYPKGNGYSIDSVALKDVLTQRARNTLFILLGTSTLVLLIACANVANLALARLLRREREIAVRLALGASRSRITRQLLTESAVLGVAGGALGLLLALNGMSLLIGFAERFTPRAREIHIDGWVMLFTFVVSLGTSLVFGSLPVLREGGAIVTALREGGRSTSGKGSGRLRALLIVAQVAASFMLLIGAGLLFRSLVNLQNVNPGFNPDRVLSLRADLPFNKYTTAPQTLNFAKTLMPKIAAQPGVLMAATATDIPLNRAPNAGPGVRFRIEGRDLPEGQPAPRAAFHVVSEEYFRLMGIPILRGREFNTIDRPESTRSVIINQTMARQFWGNDDPTGRRIAFGPNKLEIVGVAGDVKTFGLDRESGNELYLPFAQNPQGNIRVLVRTASDPIALSRSLTDAIHQVDADQPVDDIHTLEQVRHESLASPRLTTWLLGMFSMMALAITLAGISGVMILAVNQRMNEIGIRMALGASVASVLALILKQGVGLVAAGLLIGIAGALALTRLISTLLFGVRPYDATTFAAVTGLFLAIAIGACIVPARRAVKVDPAIALRAD